MLIRHASDVKSAPIRAAPEPPALRLGLYQPDIPQNAGTILRLCACLGVAADIIEPAGFPATDRAFRRAGMDYLDQVEIARHVSWTAFREAFRPGGPLAGRRLVLATTRGAVAHTAFTFSDDDVILLGRESAGVPEQVHAAADARIFVPMRSGLRSLNIAVAAAMLLGEALRQTGALQKLAEQESRP
jgi:tRNA (cytidine/uridine-2'-O-)-methyltransferase